MEPFPRMRPRHHGEFSAASPHGRLDRWLIVRLTTPHMEERLPRLTIIFLTCSSLPVLCLELLLVCLFNMRSVACALPLEPGFVTHGVARRVDDAIELARWDHFV